MHDDRTFRRNLFVLTAAQALGAAVPPIIISLGGIVGQTLTAVPALATLPVSLFNLGLAAGTIPVAVAAARWGRRDAYIIGAMVGMVAGLVATFGIITSALWLFCLGTFITGFYAACVQSYRFAAADIAPDGQKGRAISWVMVGGLIAAVIGPQLVMWTQETLPAAPFAGSFLSQALLATIAIPVLILYRGPRASPVATTSDSGRSLSEIMKTPRFVLASSAGVISFGLMSFVMTAAPMAMIECGFTVGEAAFGIQWHVLAMFAPSFFTGELIARYGNVRITAFGLLLLSLSGVVALAGLDLHNFVISLILLGIGWNFGFIGATSMITDCHTPEERNKVQGANDFIVFGTVAFASFASGSLLSAAGWAAVNWFIFPAVAVVLVPLIWSGRMRRTVS